MAAPTYEEKLSAQFDVFDRTGDGVLSRADFQAKAMAVLGEFGVQPFTPEGDRLMAGAHGFWNGLCDRANVSPDGKMSKEEFVGASMQVLVGRPEGFHQLVAPWVMAEFEIADADDSDKLEVGEWARLLRTRGHDEAAIAQRFADHDIVVDGLVTRSEVLRSAYAFYSTEDAPDLGSALD
jgi:hypothetical protein